MTRATDIKPAHEPMRYRRDVAADDQIAIDAEVAHIRAHLSAIADADDDPDTHYDDVTITMRPHVDGNPRLVSIIGELDEEPDAPYLHDDFDPDADTQFAYTPYVEEGKA